MFDLESRKNNTKIIVDLTSKWMLYFSKNKIIAGWLAVSIHIIFGVFIIFNLLKKKVNNNYHIYVLIWAFVIYSNYYFNGCILARIEKEIFQDKYWRGPINLLLFKFKKDKELLNNFIKYCIAAPVCTIIILKYLYNKNPVAIFLMIIFIPLLFIHSQSNIFEYFFTKNINYCEEFKLNLNNSRFDNKVIAITGCSSGIGERLSIWFKNNTNAKIICLNRNNNNNNNLNLKTNIYIDCDLTDFLSVTNAYKKIISLFPNGVDILINNAGITNSSNSNTKDGYNKQIQTNYISHALLSELLIKNHNKDEENKKKKIEIINISSMSFNIPKKKYDETFFCKDVKVSNYSIQDIYYSHLYYQQSKLAMLLYTNYLNKKVLNNNSNIKIYSLHPGMCKTGLLDKSKLPFFFKTIVRCFSRSIDFPCEFIIKCIGNEKIKCGDFYGINAMSNNIEKIENNDLIDDKSSYELYIHTKKICDGIII
jgi:NAD(P)-dependent dehydrogenase (short-subunit alcohol dehydrogenase family)